MNSTTGPESTGGPESKGAQNVGNSAAGKLFVISGPSAAGKTTLLKRVYARCRRPLDMSVSATTRKPREGEVDGVHYHFLSRDEFERRYDVMPQLRRAELIEGVVHVPSPVRQRCHSAPHSSLVGWLQNG